MNRASWTTTDPPPPAAALLPPAQCTPGGPARLLFIHGSELGFATTAANLERCTAARDDVDAVHIRVPVAGWARLAATASPVALGHLDQQPFRLIWASERLILRAFKQLPLNHFDVIHFMTQQKGRVILRLRRAALRGRVVPRLVVNSDATSPAYVRAFGLHAPPWALYHRTEKAIFRAADMVACASRWVADSAVLDEGAEPSRVILHKPCAIRDASMPARRAADARPPIRLVFVGNDWERKGGPRLVQWHQRLWKDRAELHVCSRSAPQDHSLPGIVWHGQTQHSRLMSEILPSCDVFVMPTTGDTFLIAAQEAQAVGLPVVTSRLAGIPEVVRHARTGFLCPPLDDAAFVHAISRLIDEQPLRLRMAAAALEHADHNLSGLIWHNHLITQLVNLAGGRPIRYAPEGVDVRRDDDEANNPATAQQSIAFSASPSATP